MLSIHKGTYASTQTSSEKTEEMSNNNQYYKHREAKTACDGSTKTLHRTLAPSLPGRKAVRGKQWMNHGVRQYRPYDNPNREAYIPKWMVPRRQRRRFIHAFSALMSPLPRDNNRPPKHSFGRPARHGKQTQDLRLLQREALLGWQVRRRSCAARCMQMKWMSQYWSTV